MFKKSINERFNGDINKAFDYIINSCSKEEFDLYFNSFTEDELSSFRKYMNDIISKNVPADKLEKIVEEQYLLGTLNLTKDEVVRAEINPFKAKVNKSLLKFLIVDGGLIFTALAANLFGVPTDVALSWGGAIALISNGFIASETTSHLIDYVKFNKLKKIYSLEVKDENMG